jgi:protoporphyrinogen oxidase
MLEISGGKGIGGDLTNQEKITQQENSGASQPKDVVIGAGIAGLAAAYLLQQNGRDVQVFESDSFHGGMGRTVAYKGFRFDLGGHRFYTKNEQVNNLVKKLVGNDLLTVERISRIFMNGKFVNYPLSFFSALSALSITDSLQVFASYIRSRLPKKLGGSRPNQVVSFEDWVVSRFGKKLYQIYFKPYTEKVWGVPCEELAADFAEQRIKGLSFRAVVRDMIKKFDRKKQAASLIKWFSYPRYGFGQIPDAMVKGLKPGSLHLSSPLTACLHDGKRINKIIVKQGGESKSYPCRELISTMPIDEFVKLLQPAAPANVIAAAQKLRYRDLVVCFLTMKREQVTRDHWIYFTSQDIFFGRSHEPKNWSAAMAPQGETGLVVEIFCFKNDPIWFEKDDVILDRIVKELDKLNLIKTSEYTGGCAVRLEKAYPLYTPGYEKNLNTIIQYLDRFENMQCAGRNGLFCYSSGDRHIEMGLKAAENILGERHDVAKVAKEQVYAES